MRNPIISTALATIALAVTAAPAAAEPISVRVGFADLDITTEAGMQTLESRIENAARNLCSRRLVRDVYREWPRSVCIREVQISVEPQLAALRHPNRGTVEFVTIALDGGTQA